MDREARRAAKAQMIAQMQAGLSWQEAATTVGVQTSRTAAYRLLQRVRTEGAAALEDQRHGHPVKLREPVREWLAEFCRAAPASSGRSVQAALFEQFGLLVSISQVNRLRAAQGVRRPAPGVGEKSATRFSRRVSLAGGSRESAAAGGGPGDQPHLGPGGSAPNR